MTKKRRSLTSILVPSFLPQASASTSSLSPVPPSASRARSNSSVTTTSTNEAAAIENSADWISFYSGAPSPLSSVGPVTPSRNSPPPDLLDEDPFANLSPSPSLRASHATSPVRTVFDVFGENVQRLPEPPLSPLAQSALGQEVGARSLRNARSVSSLRNSPSTPPPSPIEPTRPRAARRTKSSGPPQVRPAYTRPAFAPRPSLPSLNTLASTTTIPVPKVSQSAIHPAVSQPFRLRTWSQCVRVDALTVVTFYRSVGVGLAPTYRSSHGKTRRHRGSLNRPRPRAYEALPRPHRRSARGAGATPGVPR